MHAIQARGIATREDVPPQEIFGRVIAFFEARIAALTAGGIAASRLILDPGMGFFLGTNPETSLTMLGRFPELKKAFGLPVLLSVSRKSFLRAMAKGDETQLRGMTAAAEAMAVAAGADYIRTHEPAALRDALKALKTMK
jgi:dihydropteroate synthase type 2